MSEFPELIKSIEHLRGLIREFFIFGFKTREDYDKKSKRTYDLEKRRIETYFEEYFGGVTGQRGKRVSIAIDSGEIRHNPIYRLFKAKSFTKNDLILHFLILDAFSDLDGATVREFSNYVSLHYAVPSIEEMTQRFLPRALSLGAFF